MISVAVAVLVVKTRTPRAASRLGRFLNAALENTSRILCPHSMIHLTVLLSASVALNT